MAKYKHANFQEDIDVYSMQPMSIDDMIQANFEKKGIIPEAVKDSVNVKIGNVERILDNDDLEEAMLCSDAEIEKAEAAIMKHLYETLDINDMDKYFGVADEDLTDMTDENRDNQILEEEEAMRTIQEQAKEINRYAVLNIENEDDGKDSDLNNVEKTGPNKIKQKPQKKFNFSFKFVGGK